LKSIPDEYGEVEDTKGVISIRKSKDRQHNGQQEKGQKWKQRYTQIVFTNHADKISNTAVI
jgi:hypothetical protein